MSDESISQMLQLLFAPSDTILIRPIETWTEGDKKRSRVDHKGVRYHRTATLVTCFDKILTRSEHEKSKSSSNNQYLIDDVDDPPAVSTEWVEGNHVRSQTLTKKLLENRDVPTRKKCRQRVTRNI